MRAIVEYDGTGYAGFQRQRQAPSIQGILETAIAGSVGHEVRITAAGRTDAGAHAVGQTVSFRVNTRLDDEALLRAVNAHLPADVALQSACTTYDSFDPRREATLREYHYLVLARRSRAPLWVNRACRVCFDPDLGALREAAGHLIGVHDFSAFATPSRPDGSPVREISRCEIVSKGELFRFVFAGTGFMQGMVRTMVGTLLLVGSRKIAPGEVRAILESRDRSRAGQPAPSCGLYLMNVTYGASQVKDGTAA